MSHSQWHRFYTSKVAASPELLFGLLSDAKLRPLAAPIRSVRQHNGRRALPRPAR